MAHHKIDIIDGGTPADKFSPVLIKERLPFIVVNPMFKNGKAYEPGETIMLDEDTAERFKQAGDIE